GSIDTAEGPRNGDAHELSGASNVAAAYEDVNPYLLAMPASPHLAARAEGVTIAPERIVRAYERLAARSDVIIVEGAGGWYAPISATGTMADIAQKMYERLAPSGFPLSILLVVGMRLGCLNHALLTCEAIRARGLPFAGWIANKLQAEMPLVRENIDTLTSRFGAPPVAVVPAGVGASGMGPPSWAMQAVDSLVSL
ncbi:MAG: dethiobiotin synthase, partial [Burkholderiales bacterium]|nr:dethiobiotin synthase [Burkholderiales bacterium]